MKSHRKILAVAAAVMLGLTTTGGAALARIGSFSGGHMVGGFRGGPYLGDTTSTPSPIFNPSSGYTHQSRRQVLDQYSTNRRVR